jgi:hypothetical protein
MAEFTTFPEEPRPEPTTYRRMSALALAGFAIGILFASYVLIGAGIGFWTGTPLLLHPVVQPVPVVGIVLSVLGLIAIGRSEGTLAGRALALWGVWLSLLMGLGYFAYYGATYFATCQQADDFTLRWYQKLAQGKIIPAFLDGLDPERRQQVNADDLDLIFRRFNAPVQGKGAAKAPSYKGQIDIFRSTEYIKAIAAAGPETNIESLGISDWQYKDGAYKVQRVYRITTPDAMYDILTPVVGRESSKHEFEGRQWSVLFMETKLQGFYPSQLGVRIRLLRQESGQFARRWMQKIMAGNLTSAILDTMPPERSRAERAILAADLMVQVVSDWALSPTTGFSTSACRIGAALDRDMQFKLARNYYPEINDLLVQGKLLGTQQVEPTDPASRDIVIDAVKEALRGGSAVERPRLGQVDVSYESTRGRWQTDNEQRLISPHECTFFAAPRNVNTANPRGYAGVLVITVQSGPGAADPAKGDIIDTEWQIKQVELVKAAEALLPSGSQEQMDSPTPTMSR